MDPRWNKLEQAKGNDGTKKKEMKLKKAKKNLES